MRVGNPVTLQHDRTTNELGASIALDEEIAAERNVAADRLLERTRIFVDHPHFERRGATEDVLRARGVLDARQLHNDAINTLLLDDRLGDTELVDAIAQDRDVLLDSPCLDPALRLLLDRRNQLQVGGRRINALEHQVVVECRGDDLALGLPPLGLVAETEDDVLTFATDAGIADGLVAQEGAQVGDVAIGSLVERRLHVDLQHEVDAAAQVETEVHRQRADR